MHGSIDADCCGVERCRAQGMVMLHLWWQRPWMDWLFLGLLQCNGPAAGDLMLCCLPDLMIALLLTTSSLLPSLACEQRSGSQSFRYSTLARGSASCAWMPSVRAGTQQRVSAPWMISCKPDTGNNTRLKECIEYQMGHTCRREMRLYCWAR